MTDDAALQLAEMKLARIEAWTKLPIQGQSEWAWGYLDAQQEVRDILENR